MFDWVAAVSQFLMETTGGGRNMKKRRMTTIAGHRVWVPGWMDVLAGVVLVVMWLAVLIGLMAL